MGRMYQSDNPRTLAGQSGPNETMECPWCGRQTGNLPKHIRACDGGAD